MITLVIADDMEELRTYLCEEITRCADDIRVVGTAASAREAVRLCRELHPRVVLMDSQMEYMTAGIDAIETVHKELPDIKCIMLTIHANDEYLLRAYTVGASDYIIKTNEPERIVHSIREVVNNQLFLRPDVAHKILNEYLRMQQSQEELKKCLRIMMTLSISEYEILRLLYDGYTYRDIASQRFVQESTIRSHVNHILKKFDKRRMREVIQLLRENRFFDVI